ncbi:MAG: hypothetical protein RL385_4768, partial [Pseudomonadota bacterium]
ASRSARVSRSSALGAAAIYVAVGMIPLVLGAIAAGTAVTYTVFGGLLADAYTDVVQGTVLVFCLVFLLVSVTQEVGGVDATWGLLQAARAPAAATSAMATLDAWLVPAVGSLFAQELVARPAAVPGSRAPLHSERPQSTWLWA